MQHKRWCMPLAMMFYVCPFAAWGQAEPTDVAGAPCGNLSHAGADLLHYHFEASNSCTQPIEVIYTCDKKPQEITLRLAPDASVELTCEKVSGAAGQIDYRFLPVAPQ